MADTEPHVPVSTQNVLIKNRLKREEISTRGSQSRRTVSHRAKKEIAVTAAKSHVRVDTAKQIEGIRSANRASERDARIAARDTRIGQAAVAKRIQDRSRQRGVARQSLATSVGDKVAPAPSGSSSSGVGFRTLFMSGLLAIFGMIVLYDFLSHPGGTKTFFTSAKNWISSISQTTPLFTASAGSMKVAEKSTSGLATALKTTTP